MDKYLYICILAFSLFGMALLDYKKRLFLFSHPKRAVLILFCAVVFFLLWDIAGIALNVFFTNQQYVSGVHLFTPDLPIEELLFLTLVCYVSVQFSILLESHQ